MNDTEIAKIVNKQVVLATLWNDKGNYFYNIIKHQIMANDNTKRSNRIIKIALSYKDMSLEVLSQTNKMVDKYQKTKTHESI